MIEGIDYYPKKGKSKIKFKYWILLLLVVLAAAYWYSNTQQSLETTTPTRIVISKPQVKSTTNTIPISIKPDKIKEKAPEILENLDELLPSQEPL